MDDYKTDHPGDRVSYDVSLLSDEDLHLFNEGSHFRLYEKLGAHRVVHKKEVGFYFAVWAPDAEQVFVSGDFNGWSREDCPLRSRGQSGIWEGFVFGIPKGSPYKYHIRSRYHAYRVDKADPFAFVCETPPKTASVVWDLDYHWGDGEWMGDREKKSLSQTPWAVYEVHIGSWMTKDGSGRPLTYRELAPRLTEYVLDMGFTHVEFLPVMEHPFFGSWGYQTAGYFSPTSRYGTPQDFMFLIDYLHQQGIGVILDWVPSHFVKDEHGLGFFDGTHLFEHADPRNGVHPDWDSYIFNYGRLEVQSFLISSALFWLDKYHADGLRVDAVASMLYLDYSREEGEWFPNQFGGRENLEAISFLRRLNEEVYGQYPGVQTIAEESTDWPMVSKPTYLGGLGFGMKWDMGWMHDTLDYLVKDAIHRKFHHNQITFRMLYAFHENFILPLSHDEVVHGKGSLLAKMPGDDWQKFANLRLLFGGLYAQPGKKLIFMGGEIGQWKEWDHDGCIQWDLLAYLPHQGVQSWVRDLNHFYRDDKALHGLDFEPGGFEWIDCNDSQQSVLSFLRRGRQRGENTVIVLNFTPVPRFSYSVGVDRGGIWAERLNSDGKEYGGSGMGNMGRLEAEPVISHGRPYSLRLTLPPLSALFLKRESDRAG